MATSIENLLSDGTCSALDWYPLLWDTDPLNQVDFNDLANGLSLELLDGDVDLTQFSDKFAASSAPRLDFDAPRSPEQLATPPEDGNFINIFPPQDIELPDEIVADTSTSSEGSPASIVDPSYSPTSPKSQGSRGSHGGSSPLRQKTLHNAVERRYRDNMNAKFLALAQKMPTLYGNDAEVVMGRKPPKRKTGELYQSKADVLENALSYIDQLHKEKKALTNRVTNLKKNLQAAKAEHRNGTLGIES